MLMKTYKPQLKSREELVSESEANGGVDLETGLSYAQLCEGFTLGSNGSKEQSRQLLPASSSATSASAQSSVSLLIKGWQVERFIKVVLSTHNIRNNRFKNYAFAIDKRGLKEV